MYKRILAALDGSRSAHRALEEAVKLAVACDGMLFVATVAEQEPSLVDPVRGVVETSVLDRASRKAGQRELDYARELCSQHKVPLHAWVVDAHGASLPAAIMQAALAVEADLIAMGTHGRRGIRRHLLGSVAETILRSSHVPVLMVREGSSNG